MIRNTLCGTIVTRLAFAGLLFLMSGLVAQPASAQLEAIIADGRFFEVKPATTSADEHKGAAIGIVKTAIARAANARRYGLLFVERNKNLGVSGQAMMCPNATVLQNDSPLKVALSCSQIVGNKVEVLTVGTLNSDFCDEQRKDEEKAPYVLPEDQCESKYGGNNPLCVCYDLEHFPFRSRGKAGFDPPTSGSGSGGRG